MADEPAAEGRENTIEAAVLPGMSTALKAGIVAALYCLYLLANSIFGSYFGQKTYYWHEAVVELTTMAALLWASRVTPRPYRVFLRILAVSMLMLTLSAVTFEQDAWTVATGTGTVFWWEIAYSLFLFLWICAWGYLTVELWDVRRPSLVTGVVFVVLMIGLALIYIKFYPPLLREAPAAVEVVAASSVDAGVAAEGAAVGEAASSTPLGDQVRGGTDDLEIKQVHATLELAAVMVGLATVLLGVPGPLVAMVFGMTTLAAFQMAYTTVGENVALVDPMWMLGLCIFLAGALAVRREDAPEKDKAAGTALSRSGLSGLLLLLSLGAVLLVVIAEQSFSAGPWVRPFLLTFVVFLVMAMVWITDRFDRAVVYLRSYADELVGNKLRGPIWRRESTTIQGILTSTGLGGYLDHLRGRFDSIRDDIIFLGPERLHRPPDLDSDEDGRLRCFLVMPFSTEWSDEVHRIIREACRSRRVSPIRGDDLFSPTDIVEDIWQAIHTADFVLADITGRNPNVLYELGIAHTIAKPVLILSQKAEDIPIDLATRRVLVYDRKAENWQGDLEAKVSHAIGEILTQYGFEPPEAGYEIWPTSVIQVADQQLDEALADRKPVDDETERSETS